MTAGYPQGDMSRSEGVKGKVERPEAAVFSGSVIQSEGEAARMTLCHATATGVSRLAGKLVPRRRALARAPVAVRGRKAPGAAEEGGRAGEVCCALHGLKAEA